MGTAPTEDLARIRRRFHRYPEPAWREFYTTSLIVEELERIGIDEIAVGPEAYDPADRMAVPDDSEWRPWYERAERQGADPDILQRMDGANTGAIAVIDRGDGLNLGLRVDIDGLSIEEADDEAHIPAAEGFRSEYPGTMHACGHDAHMAIGLGVIEAIASTPFDGRLVVFFQPAEETAGGGKPMATSSYADDLDYLLAVHIGLGHPTGEVVAGIERPLAMSHLTTEFTGTAAHAGKAPNEGDNAIQAAATAIQNVYGIPRHCDGETRVNVGRIEAGNASNVIAERAILHGEVRGETTALREYAKWEFERTVHAAAEMHDCEARMRIEGESPRADSDAQLVNLVEQVAREHDRVDSPVRWTDFGASEDATYLMERVQENGGLATYVIIGSDNPSNHHTPRFDIDEASLDIGVEVLTDTLQRIIERQPGPSDTPVESRA